MAVYPHKTEQDAVTASGKILFSLSGYFTPDLASGMWAQMKSDNGLVMLPMNVIAEGDIILYAREVQL